MYGTTHIYSNRYSTVQLKSAPAKTEGTPGNGPIPKSQLIVRAERQVRSQWFSKWAILNNLGARQCPNLPILKGVRAGRVKG
jgi:hypothetical protein